MSSLLVGLHIVMFLNFSLYFNGDDFSSFFSLTVDPLELTDYHYSFLGSQEYQPREESMSTTPREDDSSRTLIPSKLGKQAGGIRGTPKTPCYRKADAVEAAEAEVISSDDDFEKIAYPKNAKCAAGTVTGKGGKNVVITRRKPAVESGNITSSKRASRLPLKWRSPVAPLKNTVTLIYPRPGS